MCVVESGWVKEGQETAECLGPTVQRYENEDFWKQQPLLCIRHPFKGYRHVCGDGGGQRWL